MTIAVVDYGAGNMRSVLKSLEYLGEEPVVARHPEQVLAADRLVLPGVGAAAEAIARLEALGLDEALDEAVRKRGRPLLGICLGMQLLAERLLEFGEHRGLGWIEGEVVNIRSCLADETLSVPHMGWNEVTVHGPGEALFRNVRAARQFYFAHSFTLRTHDTSSIAATCDYGTELVIAVCKDNFFATQFHPEKSQISGEQLIAAFLDWNP